MALFLRVLVFVFVLAVLLRVGELFAAAWFLLGLYLVARTWVHRSVRRIDASRRYSDHAFCGSEVAVELRVRNSGWLPIPWLELTEPVVSGLGGSAQAHALSLGPRGRRSLPYTITCRQRGYYPLGPASVETGDVFGLGTRAVTVGGTDHLTVYPRIVPLQRLGLPTRSPLAEVLSKTPLFEDTSRVIGVRDYRSGDPLRNIHWTSTAKTGRLVVKQYQTATSRETTIFLDLSAAGYPVRRYQASEQAIVVAASLANHISDVEGLPVGLSFDTLGTTDAETHRVSLRPRAGKAQLIAILELLARAEVTSESSFPALLNEESATLGWGSTVVVITGDLTPELAMAILRLKQGGHAMVLILVQPSYVQASYHSAVPGVPLYRIGVDPDLARLA